MLLILYCTRSHTINYTKLSTLPIIGCHWQNYFVGALAYADDIALLAPSPSALRSMLKVCTSFAEAHHLVFNPDKTQFIHFSRKWCTNYPSITFLGHDELKLSKSISHLGHLLSYDLDDSADVDRVISEVCRQGDYLLSTFSSCNALTKSQLFYSYCLSLYGSVLWNFGRSKSSLNRLQITVNTILRRIWHLPRRCHTSILHLVSGTDSIINLLILRHDRFLRHALRSHSLLATAIFQECSSLAYTSTGANCLNAASLWKSYTEEDKMCAEFIQTIRLYNIHLCDEVCCS